jgi:hypothetical protein
MRANILHFFCLPVGTAKPSQPTAPTTSSKEQFSDFFYFCGLGQHWDPNKHLGYKTAQNSRWCFR